MKNITLLSVLLASIGIAHAVPTAINYQGRLTDGDGNPASGSKLFSLSLYDAATAGNELYTEIIGSIAVDDNGIYNFQFGANGTSTVAEAETLAVTDGSSTVYTATPSATPIAGTLSVSDGTYSWNEVDGNPGELATATTQLGNGFVIGYAVTNGGEGYTIAPVVTINGDGIGATATAEVTNGVVTAINVGDVGSGYTNATVSIAEPPAPFVVDYSAGELTFTYEAAPSAGVEITASYDANDNSIVGALSAADSHWLELSIDGATQSPRERVLSVPFAQVAGVSYAASGEQLQLLNQLSEEIIYLQSGIPSPNSSTQNIDLTPEILPLEVSMPSSLSDNPKNYSLPVPIYSREFSISGGMGGITRFDLRYEDGSSASALSRINPFPAKKITRISYDHNGNFRTATIQFYINESKSILLDLNDILPIKGDKTRLWLFAGGNLSPGDRITARLVGPSNSYELNVNNSINIPADFSFYENLEITLEPGFEPSSAAQISFLTIRFSR